MRRLILIGGPPGVGKSTVAARFAESFERAAWLDGDDVWRIRPFEVVDRTRALVERNISAVLRGFLEADYPVVVLAWVLHRQDLIARFQRELGPLADTIEPIHLIARPEVLEARQQRDGRRLRDFEHTLVRLQQIKGLPYPRIDTSELSPDEVVERLRAVLGAS